MSWKSDIIDFEPNAHSYTNRRTQRKYLGITSFIGKFEPIFPMEFASARSAVKELYGNTSYKYSVFANLVRSRKTQEEKEELVKVYYEKSKDKDKLLKIQAKLKKEWKEENLKSLVKGSAFHQEQEDKTNYNQFRIINERVRRVADVTNYPRSFGNKVNLAFDLPDGIHPEILLVNHEYELAGQADYMYVETINGVRYVDIDDWKTNKKLTSTNAYNKFLPPIDFIEHTKMDIYRMQILLYAWLAEQAGFVPRRLTLTWQPDKRQGATVFEIKKYSELANPLELMLKVRKNELELLNL